MNQNWFFRLTNFSKKVQEPWPWALTRTKYRYRKLLIIVNLRFICAKDYDMGFCIVTPKLYFRLNITKYLKTQLIRSCSIKLRDHKMMGRREMTYHTRFQRDSLMLADFD